MAIELSTVLFQRGRLYKPFNFIAVVLVNEQSVICVDSSGLTRLVGVQRCEMLYQLFKFLY